MYKLTLILVILAVMFMPSAAGLQLEDNFFFTIPSGEAPPELRCSNVVFPDAAGVLPYSGLETYTLSTDTDWASLTYRIITTDGNNTVTIPMCYSQPADDLCSDPYVISILTHSSASTKEFVGGVCVSDTSDVDIVSDEVAQAMLQGNVSPAEVLNDNIDLFDIDFQVDREFAQPGEVAVFSLFIESQALLDIDLKVKNSDIGVLPVSHFTTTSSVNSFREVQYSVTSPLVEGTYSFEVEAKVRNCDLNFCSKTVKAYLEVSDSEPEDTGFSLKLFPESLNIRELRPVLYRLTIDNRGSSRSFDLDIELSEGLTTTFKPLTLNLLDHGKETISFTIVPTEPKSQYQIVVNAKTGGNSKPVTAYLSTNEMLTDTIRAAPDADNAVINNAVDEFMDNYNDSVYGQDLNEYGELIETLDHSGDSGGFVPGGLDLNVFIIIIIVVVIAILAFFFMRKKEKYIKEDIEEIV